MSASTQLLIMQPAHPRMLLLQLRYVCRESDASSKRNSLSLQRMRDFVSPVLRQALLSKRLGQLEISRAEERSVDANEASDTFT